MKQLKKRYQQQMFLTSAIIAFFIFISGLGLGFALDRYRVDDVLSSLKQNELDGESYFLEQQLIEKFGAGKCEAAWPRVTALSEELGKIGHELTQFRSDTIFKKHDYDYLLRRYFLLEIRTYISFRELAKTCNNVTNTVLFFYKIDDDASLRQGYALDEAVRQNPSISIFSFDIEYGQDPIISTLKLQYNVTSSPTIIINDGYKSEQFVSVGELREILKTSKAD